MSHVHSKGIRLSFGEGTCHLSPTKMFSGLIEKDFESLGGEKQAKLQVTHKIPMQTQGNKTED